MMMFGGPSHRLQSQIQSAAHVLDIELSCLYLPDVLLVSFDDSSTSTSSVKLIRQGSTLDLGKLDEGYKLYWKARSPLERLFSQRLIEKHVGDPRPAFRCRCVCRIGCADAQAANVFVVEAGLFWRHVFGIYLFRQFRGELHRFFDCFSAGRVTCCYPAFERAERAVL